MYVPQANASAAELDRFWQELAVIGTPIWEGNKATFFWRHPGVIPEGHPPAYLYINRVTDKEHQPLGRMRAISGTDIWTQTLALPLSIRASYGFMPHPPQPGPPPHNRYQTSLDPFSSASALFQDGRQGLSVFAGPQATEQAAWQDKMPADHGTQCSETVGGAELSLYLPSGCTTPDLLVLTDGEIWCHRLQIGRRIAHLQHLLTAADDSSFRPIAVVGIANGSTPDRIARLGGSLDFIVEATQWAAKKAADAECDLTRPERRMFAGQSLGGLVGLRAAIELAGHFDHILSQSPSMWWQPSAKCSPRDLACMDKSWIVEQFVGRPPRDVKMHLEVGSLEKTSVPWVAELQQTLLTGGWDSHYSSYTGGHDYACWRGSLLDFLSR